MTNLKIGDHILLLCKSMGPVNFSTIRREVHVQHGEASDARIRQSIKTLESAGIIERYDDNDPELGTTWW